MRRRSPDLCETRVSPAGRAVEPVFQWVLEIVILVVLLGRVEGRRGPDLGGDRPAERAAALQRLLGLLRRLPLFIGPDEDRRAVLTALVAELAGGIEGVDV